MKSLSHYNKLLLATCTLLLAPSMVLAGQAGWNNVPGGKVVNGQYQLKCGEGSGWQRCGEEESSCEFDPGEGLFPNKGIVTGVGQGPHPSTTCRNNYFPDSFPFYKCGSFNGIYREGGVYKMMSPVGDLGNGYLNPVLTTRSIPVSSDFKARWIGGDKIFPSLKAEEIERRYKDHFLEKYHGGYPDISGITFKASDGKEYYAGRLRMINVAPVLTGENPITLLSWTQTHPSGWTGGTTGFFEICEK